MIYSAIIQMAVAKILALSCPHGYLQRFVELLINNTAFYRFYFLPIQVRRAFLQIARIQPRFTVLQRIQASCG